MSDIDEMKLRRLDLTVLMVFLNLLRFRKAVDVAAHMGLTQSSISHALNRLRTIFEDPLFLRRPHGLEPTAFALGLEPRIRQAVEALDAALSKQLAFDPTEAQGVIRIAAYDAELAVLVPSLISVLDRLAPGLRVSAAAIGRREALRALEDRQVDLAFGYFWDLPDTFLAEKLVRETYLVTARQGHPVFDSEMTLEAYVAQRHLMVSMSGDFNGVVDRSLEHLGLSRHVAAVVPLFFPALATLSRSELIATLPTRLVKRHGASFGLQSCIPPLQIRPFEVSAVRHLRNARNPMIDWVMLQLRNNID
jgi:DNA-binding transcriptional LysR family regulator